MTIKTIGISCFIALGLAACAHEQAASDNSATTPAKTASKESNAMKAVRKRAAFDLGCPAEEIQIAQIEAGSFVHAASYGAICGDKKASYIERMGTVIKQ